jgi:hypothetical protein
MDTSDIGSDSGSFRSTRSNSAKILAFVAAASLALVGCAGSNDVSGPGGSGGGGGDLTGSGGGTGGHHHHPASSSSGGGVGGAGSTTASSASSASSTDATSTSASSGAGGMMQACPGGPGELDLHLATLYSNPPDLADWPVTTTLTEVDFGDGVHLAFSKQDGADRWPDVTPPGWMGPLQYTLGMAECIDGQWYASAVIEFWYGLDASGGNIGLDNQVAMNWYYDAGRWGMLAGRQPAPGETIGIFVAAGNLRNITSDDPAQSPVMERSNVVLVPMPDANGATHSF